MADAPTPTVSVSLPRNEWQALLDVVPLATMTYTQQGVAIFNAYRAVFQAIGPAAGETSA